MEDHHYQQEFFLFFFFFSNKKYEKSRKAFCGAWHDDCKCAAIGKASRKMESGSMHCIMDKFESIGDRRDLLEASQAVYKIRAISRN